MVISFNRLYQVAVNHLNTSYDLGMESHNLATIKSIQEGQPIYDKDFYGDLPFIFTTYNPLYHFIVANLPENKSNPFFTGRFVSLSAAALSFLLLFFPGYKNKDSKLLAFPIIAVIWLLLIPVFLANVVYLHPDMLGLFFSALTIICVERYTKTYSVVLAALFGTLAFGTKQNFLCATLAGLIFLCFNHRRKAILFGIMSVIFYGTFILLVKEFWGNGYWFSSYLFISKTPYYFHLILTRIGEMFKQPMFDFLFFCMGISIIYSGIKYREVIKNTPYLVYAEITAIVPLFGIGKMGGETSYFLEFILASLLWLVYFVRRFYSKFSEKHLIFFLIVFISVSYLAFACTKPADYLATELIHNRYYKSNVVTEMKREIKSLQPKNNNFLVLNTHVIYPFLEKGFFNDPITYWIMWNYGILDPSPMIKAIKDKYFSIILFVGRQNPYLIPAMYPIPSGPGPAKPLIVNAIEKNYILKMRGVFYYFTPKTNN